MPSMRAWDVGRGRPLRWGVWFVVRLMVQSLRSEVILRWLEGAGPLLSHSGRGVFGSVYER